MLKCAHLALNKRSNDKSYMVEYQSVKRKLDAPVAAKQIKKAKKPKKDSKGRPRIEGKTIEQHRRLLGDCVKSNIEVEKWCIGARTAMSTTIPYGVFDLLIAKNAKTVTPSNYDPTSSVIVAYFDSNSSLCEVFGSSKITGGTRMGSWSADKADVIYIPSTREVRVWWTMR